MKTMGIGGTIREIRHEQGLTIKNVSDTIGINQGQISRLELGQQGFRLGTLLRFATALHVPPFRLLMTKQQWMKWKRAE